MLSFDTLWIYDDEYDEEEEEEEQPQREIQK